MMAPLPDAAKLIRAFAACPDLRGVRPEDLVRLPQKGLAHAHWRIRGRPLAVRTPRAVRDEQAARGALRYQAACFERAMPSGRTPRLHATLRPSPELPGGALVVEAIDGRVPRLPSELSLIAETLAAIHALPLPPPTERPPLPDPEDAFVATLQGIERNLSFLERAGVAPAARAQIAEEAAWARDFAAKGRAVAGAAPRTLVVADAHPGNFLVTASRHAMFVDLEKGAYGSPAIDIAHATLRPATLWDPDCGIALSREDITRFMRAYFAAVGPELEQIIRPWVMPMRRLTWLRTTSVFARFLAEDSAGDLAPDAAAHAKTIMTDALTPETIALTRREWLGPDALAF